MRHQTVAEFHDAHRVGRRAVVGENEFCDPKVAAADDAADRKALRVRLDAPALLDIAAAADALAGLRIVEHGVLAVDVVLGLEIAGVRSLPMAFQRLPQGSIIHVYLRRTSLNVGAPGQCARGLGPRGPRQKRRAFARRSWMRDENRRDQYR